MRRSRAEPVLFWIPAYAEMTIYSVSPKREINRNVPDYRQMFTDDEKKEHTVLHAKQYPPSTRRRPALE
jgi:hypothetical protein